MIIKAIYTLFLALLISLFVGFGIDAFYTAPEHPRYPTELNFKIGEQTTEEQKKLQKEFEDNQERYEKEFKAYNRNVSIIAISAAIIILVLSLTLLAKINMIADGLLLGGVFTTAYAIIRGLMSDSSKFRFLIIAVGLLIALVLGYIKFIRPKGESKEQLS